MKKLELDLFPPVDDPGVLGGLPDFTHGAATRYFAALTPDDREMVQWYLQSGIGPGETELYVWELAKGYAVVDPERRFKEAIGSAHQEVRRIERFLDIFLQSTDFFPTITTPTLPVRTGSGNDYIKEAGWGRFDSLVGLVRNQILVRKHTLPLFRQVHEFLDDPSGAPEYFNQDDILREARRRKEAI